MQITSWVWISPGQTIIFLLFNLAPPFVMTVQGCPPKHAVSVSLQAANVQSRGGGDPIIHKSKPWHPDRQKRSLEQWALMSPPTESFLYILWATWSHLCPVVATVGTGPGGIQSDHGAHWCPKWLFNQVSYTVSQLNISSDGSTF